MAWSLPHAHRATMVFDLSRIGARPARALLIAGLALGGWICSMPVAMSQPGATQTWHDQQLAQAWATASLQHSPREHRWVTLALGRRTMKAFVTFPQGKPTGPAVLVLHEVFGLTDSTLATADQIAAMGHVTVAPDMLSGFAPDGGGTSAFPTSRVAGDFMTVLPNETVNANLAA